MSNNTDVKGKNNKIVLVGPGAIGTLFAFYLKSSGNLVVLADHNRRRASLISSQPIQIYSDANKLEQASVECVSNPSGLRRAKVDYLIFTVKAYDTEEAATQWRPLVGPRTHVISLQNGLGNLQILKRFFGAKKVIFAATSEASTFLSSGRVYHAARGITRIAPLSKSSLAAAERFALVLRRAGLNSVTKDNAYNVLWGKLVVNSAINPLSGITGLTNGELLSCKSTRNLLSEIALETYLVGRHAAHANPDIEDAEDPSNYVLKAAAATARNKSSMLQDIQRRKRTEIDFINGAICRLAKSKGNFRAPLNETMHSIVKNLEERNTSKSLQVDYRVATNSLERDGDCALDLQIFSRNLAT